MTIILKILLPTILVVATVIAAETGVKKIKAAEESLTCYACEISNSTEKSCNLTYKCDTNDFCETLISRVDGHDLAVILSCASQEKCQAENSAKTLDDCEISK